MPIARARILLRAWPARLGNSLRASRGVASGRLFRRSRRLGVSDLLCGRRLVAASMRSPRRWLARGFVRSASCARQELSARHDPQAAARDRAGSCTRIWSAFVFKNIRARYRSYLAWTIPPIPAIEVVRSLMASFPDRDIELVINSRRHGANRKVSNLINMVSKARHDVLVMSDSDIIVDRDYLKNIAASPGPARRGAGDLSLPWRRGAGPMVSSCRCRNRLSLSAERACRAQAWSCHAMLWLDDCAQDEHACHDRRIQIGRRTTRR